MEISQTHQGTKRQSYWDDLVEGNTSQYKERIMEELTAEYFPSACGSILDMGCGTCETILKYGKRLGAARLTCADYDAKIIEAMKAKHADKDIHWHVADIFDLSGWTETYDLILMMDMLHEIYSFYGRPDKNIDVCVDHVLGQSFVREALGNLAQLTNPGGGIIITDNVLCEENTEITVEIKTDKALRAVRFFLENYPTKKIVHAWQGDNVLKLNSRDFCILCTQYNKIKNDDLVRWNTERMEIHQYMTLKEYDAVFTALGFRLHAVVGTPRPAWDEWNADFTARAGLDRIPDKRITLLAVKH